MTGRQEYFPRCAPLSLPTARPSPTRNSCVSTPNSNLHAQQGEFHPYREVLQSVVRGFGKHLGFNPTDSQTRSLPESLPNWPPFADTIAALRKLKQRYQLAVISNVDDDLFAPTARRLQIPFDYVVTAQQARAYKPSFQMFKTGATADRRSPRSMAARRPKRLSRRNSSPVAGNRNRLGKPPLKPARIRRGQSRHRPTRPRSPQSRNPGPTCLRAENRELETGFQYLN